MPDPAPVAPSQSALDWLQIALTLANTFIGAWLGARFAYLQERRRREAERIDTRDRVVQQLAIELMHNKALVEAINDELVGNEKGTFVGVAAAGALAGQLEDAAWSQLLSTGSSREISQPLLDLITRQHAGVMGARGVCLRHAARIDMGLRNGVRHDYLMQWNRTAADGMTKALTETAEDCGKALALLKEAFPVLLR